MEVVQKVPNHGCMDGQKMEKRFCNRETILFLRISQLPESIFTLSWLADILELGNGLIA